jgi:hypothetical protein
MLEKEYIQEYSGEYLGGHARFQSKNNVVMTLDSKEVKIYYDYAFSGPAQYKNPFLTFSYEQISDIQVMTSERISTLRVVVLGLLPGVFWHKKRALFSFDF